MILPVWLIWTLFGVVLLIIEIITPEFIVGSFALGSFIAAILSIFFSSLTVQLIGFIISTIIFLWKVRPMFLRYLDNEEESSTNVYNLINKTGEVTEKIKSNEEPGRVLIGGEDWMAITETGEEMEVGINVKVIKVEGVKVIVKKLNN